MGLPLVFSFIRSHSERRDDIVLKIFRYKYIYGYALESEHDWRCYH